MKRQLKYICCVVLAICLFCTAFSPLSFTASAALNADSADLSGYPEKVASLVNEFRLENGLKPLQLAPVMLKASAIRAEEQRTLYGHVRPSGKGWSTILDDVGLNSNCYAGENVAAGYETPDEVMEGWKNSPGHRAAMLGEHYQYIGVGVIYVENDPEYYFYYWQMLLISSDTPLNGARYPVSYESITPPVTLNTTATTAATTVTTTTTTTATTATTTLIKTADKLIKGDVDRDGKITMNDAALVLQYYSKHASGDTSFRLCSDASLESALLKIADVNSDGDITLDDAFAILQYDSLTSVGSTPDWNSLS